MMEMTLDRSLAFTALLEQDPSFRRLDLNEQALRISDLLKDWYLQDKIRNLWDFTAHWLSAGKGAHRG